MLSRLIGTNIANLVHHLVQSTNEFLGVFILLHLLRLYFSMYRYG